MMPTGIGDQLRACGRKGLPRRIRTCGGEYRLVRPFKHDFFAATGLYECVGDGVQRADLPAGRVVLKLGRQADFLGLPLSWLGELVSRHEIEILRRLSGVRGVPRFLGRYGRTGLIYEYIAGRSLDEGGAVPDDFFDQLEGLAKGIHERGVAYVDMNKRGNILLGSDNQAHLVDFQISLYVSRRMRRWCRPLGYLLGALQKEDIYHIYKHKRRLRADLMDEGQLRDSRRVSKWVALHRGVSKPLTNIRRRVLNFLYHKGRLVTWETRGESGETDPLRWGKYRK